MRCALSKMPNSHRSAVEMACAWLEDECAGFPLRYFDPEQSKSPGSRGQQRRSLAASAATGGPRFLDCITALAPVLRPAALRGRYLEWATRLSRTLPELARRFPGHPACNHNSRPHRQIPMNGTQGLLSPPRPRGVAPTLSRPPNSQNSANSCSFNHICCKNTWQFSSPKSLSLNQGEILWSRRTEAGAQETCVSF
jgi:hypothetical protein